MFDLGGVLIDWDPRYLYRHLFPDSEAAMEEFLSTVCTPEWNARQDAGRPWAEAVESLASEYPQHRELIAAFHDRWAETLGGAIETSVEILADLRRQRVPVFALSNWSAETFPVARRRYAFLSWFEGIVISGDLGVTKPDARIFRHLIHRYSLRPSSTVFIDDQEANVAAARRVGLIALRYEGPAKLRRELTALGLYDGSERAGS